MVFKTSVVSFMTKGGSAFEESKFVYKNEILLKFEDIFAMCFQINTLCSNFPPKTYI